MGATVVDDELQPWNALDRREWRTLLIGNGLSINLWNNFHYESLFEQANLSPQATAIFDELDTSNFEAVLECIHNARTVLEALQQDTDRVELVYEQVRDSLFRSVSDAHVPWGEFPAETHKEIAEHLDQFDAVYTTNYDLCLYWSHLQNLQSVNLVDFFWSSPGNRFDPTNVELWSTQQTPVHYLHGAVHLWQDDENENGKWTSADKGNLLALNSKYKITSSRRPLFVSEGTFKSKTRTIQRSQYLSFCLESLTNDESDTIIFGHSLSSPDQHIVNAINSGRKRNVAVSIYPSEDPNVIVESKIHFQKSLHRHHVSFFDSTTYPIGRPELRIPNPVGDDA